MKKIKRVLALALSLILLLSLSASAFAVEQRDAPQINAAQIDIPPMTYDEFCELRKNRGELRKNMAIDAQKKQVDLVGNWKFSIDMKDFLRDQLLNELTEKAMLGSYANTMKGILSLDIYTFFDTPVELNGTVFFKKNGEYEIDYSKEQIEAYLKSVEKMAERTYSRAMRFILSYQCNIDLTRNEPSWKETVGMGFEEFWEKETGEDFETSSKEYAKRFKGIRRLQIAATLLPGNYLVQSDSTNKLFYSYSTRDHINADSEYLTFTLDENTLTITDCSEASFSSGPYRAGTKFSSHFFPIVLNKMS